MVQPETYRRWVRQSRQHLYRRYRRITRTAPPFVSPYLPISTGFLEGQGSVGEGLNDELSDLDATLFLPKGMWQEHGGHHTGIGSGFHGARRPHGCGIFRSLHRACADPCSPCRGHHRDGQSFPPQKPCDSSAPPRRQRGPLVLAPVQPGLPWTALSYFRDILIHSVKMNAGLATIRTVGAESFRV